MDGFEATRQIRQIPQLKQVIVIGVSASISPQLHQEALTAGCNDSLAKPVRIDELLEKVRLYLNLEWKYEEPVELQKPATSLVQGDIIPPPPEELSKLYQLARIGNVIGLRTRAQEIADADPQFMPFGARVAHLAKELQLDELEQFIQQYMENKHL